jgi:transcriptional regulator with XRE-family HTH domain
MKISLKAARVNANLTQGDVAKRLKKSVQTIVNWENGKTPIDEGNLIALCVMYGIKEEYIFLPDVSA